MLVYTSSSEIYGDATKHPQPETYWGNVNPVGNRSPYDEGKRFAESLIMTYHRKYTLNVRIARVFNTYGLHKLAVTKNISGEIINLGNPHEKKVLELAHLIKNLTHSNSKIIFTPIGPDDPKKRKPDISKARKLLDWKPLVSLNQGLTKTVEYFKKIQ